MENEEKIYKKLDKIIFENMDDENLLKEKNAILVTGSWGVGKTKFIKDYFKTKHSLIQKENVYISLYGLNDQNDLRSIILYNIKKNYNGLKYLTKMAYIIKLVFSGALNKIIDFESGEKIYSTLKEDVFIDESLKNKIIILDDLERVYEEKIIYEVFSFINKMKENNCFFIIIAEKEKLEKIASQHKSDFFLENHLDKTIIEEIKIEKTAEEIDKIINKDIECFFENTNNDLLPYLNGYSILYPLIKHFNISNIRAIKNNLKLVKDNLIENDSEISNRAIVNDFLLNYLLTFKEEKNKSKKILGFFDNIFEIRNFKFKNHDLYNFLIDNKFENKSQIIMKFKNEYMQKKLFFIEKEIETIKNDKSDLLIKVMNFIKDKESEIKQEEIKKIFDVLIDVIWDFEKYLIYGEDGFNLKNIYNYIVDRLMEIKLEKYILPEISIMECMLGFIHNYLIERYLNNCKEEDGQVFYLLLFLFMDTGDNYKKNEYVDENKFIFDILNLKNTNLLYKESYISKDIKLISEENKVRGEYLINIDVTNVLFDFNELNEKYSFSNFIDHIYVALIPFSNFNIRFKTYDFDILDYIEIADISKLSIFELIFFMFNIEFQYNGKNIKKDMDIIELDSLDLFSGNDVGECKKETKKIPDNLKEFINNYDNFKNDNLKKIEEKINLDENVCVKIFCNYINSKYSKIVLNFKIHNMLD